MTSYSSRSPLFEGVSVLILFFIQNELGSLMSLAVNQQAPKVQFVLIGGWMSGDQNRPSIFYFNLKELTSNMRWF